MATHGEERNLPVTPLAQWMRDTTGVQGYDNDPVEFIVTSPAPNTIRVVTPIPREIGFVSGDIKPESPFEFDKSKLYQAAREAVETYINEGHTQEEVLVHERRIWALHDKLIGGNHG